MEKTLKQTDFISLDKAWFRRVENEVKKREVKRINQMTFDIGLKRKLLAKLTRKNITRGICIVNMVIPFTFFPATNIIICKISNKCDTDKIGRKINCIKMRFM